MLTHRLWNFRVRFCYSYISVKCTENITKELLRMPLVVALSPYSSMKLNAIPFFYCFSLNVSVFYIRLSCSVVVTHSYLTPQVFWGNIQVKWLNCPYHMLGKTQIHLRPLEKWDGVAYSSSRHISFFNFALNSCSYSHQWFLLLTYYLLSTPLHPK